MTDLKSSLKNIVTSLSDRAIKLLKTLGHPLIFFSKKIVLPGFYGVPLYDVVRYFIHGIRKGSLIMRANALTFSIVLAFVPAIIFFFSLIPYIPVPDLKYHVLQNLQEALPQEAYTTIKATIEDIITRQRGGLLSLSFVISTYLASNGIIGVIKAFNQSSHSIENRSPLQIRIISILLVLALSLMAIIGAGLMTFSTILLEWFMDKGLISNDFNVILLKTASWIVLILLVLTAFSTLYYLAPAKRGTFRFISPGSLLSTFLTVVFFILFGLYVDSSGAYNKFYGSLEAIFIILVWINLTSMVLLVGFEVNASIYSARKHLL